MQTKGIVMVGLLLGLFSIFAVGCVNDGRAELPTSTPAPKITTLLPTATQEVDATSTVVVITPSVLSKECETSLRSLTASAEAMDSVYVVDTPTYEVFIMIMPDRVLERNITVRIYSDFQSNKRTVEEWFGDRGCSLPDMCTLSVQFWAPKELYRDFTPLPTGCKIEPLG